MATPTIYKQRPHPEIVIHNRQPCEVLGWFDATRYSLTDGKRKFTALASECSEAEAITTSAPVIAEDKLPDSPRTDAEIGKLNAVADAAGVVVPEHIATGAKAKPGKKAAK